MNTSTTTRLAAAAAAACVTLTLLIGVVSLADTPAATGATMAAAAVPSRA